MQKNIDVIIAGSGVAGLYAAINLPPHIRALVITKREMRLCNSALAQGGIAAVYKDDLVGHEDSPVAAEKDNIQLHTNDTLIAGGFKNNLDTLKILVSSAAYDIGEILRFGVDFDKNPDGTYHRTLEGGHCRHRIFHHKDTTGYEVLCRLCDEVAKHPNIEILENALLCDLQQTSTGFSADILVGGEHIYCNSHFALLATGGIGRVYEYTTNSAIATGDGIALAYEMGAQIKNLSLVQFHPTAFNDKKTRECFLISESVRGEGAYLLNCDGERFMHNYDDRLELAPRDVVSHAIIMESRRTGSDNFYLDITHKDPEFVRERFPMINKQLLERGLDMTRDRIPIFPCQHYLMGGINVGTNAETSIKNLYAAGECSHTGVHGNNRLASNSLLEALVFSRQAAADISEKFSSAPDNFEQYPFKERTDATPIPHGIRTEIRHIMQSGYFVIPDRRAILDGYERIVDIRNNLENGNYIVNADYVEAKSLATIAYLILKEVI